MTVLIGMVSLGVEVSYLLLAHRQMQSAADAAALAGADALSAGNTTGITTEADAVAARNGFANGVNSVVVTISNPPVDGVHAGDDTAVEAKVAQPQSLTLITLFQPGIIAVSAKAVAQVVSAGLYCALALDPTASKAFAISNNAIVTNPNCGVAVDSSSSKALTLGNNAEIKGPVDVVGGYSIGNNAVLDKLPVATAMVADPYANVALQTPPSCTSQTVSSANNATVNLTAGHFCTGWNLGNNATLNLAPGVYYVDTKLTMGNSAVLNGMGGVTIVVNGTYVMSFGNNAVVNLTAPTSGLYAGLAFFGPRNSTSAVTQTFGNNVEMNVTGAIYFPSQTISWGNNGNIGAAVCTQVIADIINASNNVTLDNNCSGTAVVPIGGSKTRLVQ